MADDTSDEEYRGSVSYGGPALPDWLDGTLRDIVGATGHPREGRA